MEIKAIIFDLDGVLIDATEWHYRALNKALKLFGNTIGRDDHIKIYNGLPTKEKLKIMSSKGELSEGLHQIIRDCKKIYTQQEIEQNCKPDYEKIIMLNNLKKKYDIACCSNAIKESVVEMLTRAGLIDYFDLIIGNDEISKPKPDPEIYMTAFKYLKLMPSDCLIVEDAPHGVKAAKASNANVLKVKGYKDVNLTLLEEKLCKL